MKVENLEIGALYGDRDGVNLLFYVGKSYLYDFVVAEYDEEKCDYFKTNEEIRLTEREVKNLIEW